MSDAGTGVVIETRGAGGGARGERARSRETLSDAERRDLVDKIKLDHPLLDLLARLGIRMRKRAGWWEGNCPFPNHADPSPSFKVNAKQPETFHCFGCSAHGNIFTVARDLYGMATFAEQVMFVTGRAWGDWVKDLPPNAEERARLASEMAALRERREEERRREEEKWRPVPDHVVGPVYEALIERLELDAHGRAEMERRGMPGDVAYAAGYRTFPVSRDERIRLCEDLIRADFNLSRVPGFFRLPPRLGASSNKWCIGGNPWGRRDYREDELVWEVRGILVPLCDEEGRIVQVKLRNEAKPDDLPEKFRKLWPPKYMVQGSEDRKGGARPPLRAHHTGPADGGAYPGVLWPTEGEIKADISALYLNARFCGLPGVSQSPELALDAAARGGFREVRVAMDAEPEKSHVQFAIEQLCRGAERRGLVATVALWESDWRGQDTKGLDDLVAKGGSPSVLAHAEWWDQLDGAVKEYVEARLAGSCSWQPADI